MGLAMAQQLLRSGNTLICIARSTNVDLSTELQILAFHGQRVAVPEVASP